MKVVAIRWKDTAEHKDESAERENDDPLVTLLSVGFHVGTFKDVDGVQYEKLCYKKAQDGSEGNDDWIAIPSGCIISISQVGET